MGEIPMMKWIQAGFLNTFRGWLCGFFILLAALLPAQEQPETGASAQEEEAPLLRSFVVLCSDTLDPLWIDSLLLNLGRLSRLRELYLWPERLPGTRAGDASDTEGSVDISDLVTDDSGTTLDNALRWAALHDYAFVLILDQAVSAEKPDTVRVSYRVLKVLSRLEQRSGSFEDFLPSEKNLNQTFWLPLLAELDPLEAQKGQGLLTIRAVPGTRVTGFSSLPIVIDSSGEAALPVLVPGTYRYSTSAEGYRSQSGVYTLRESSAILSLAQHRASQWLIEQGFVMGQFADAWLYRLFFNETLRIGMGLQQYWAGINYPSVNDLFPYTEPVISLPLIQPGVTLEYVFLDGTSFLRPYLSAAFMLRLNTSLLRLDPAAAMVLGANGGLEWRLGPGFAAFFELGAAFYPFCNGLYLVASHGGESQSPSTFFYSGSWYLDIPLFRLGVRFFL